MEDICTLYHDAPLLAQQGERVLSTDELTGVQALERKEPNLPLRPGKVERREFEYVRHGTRTFILNRDVVSGQIIAPSDGPTRTEEDFVAHVQHTIAADPNASRWHFVVDNLDIHSPASLYVAFAPREAKRLADKLEIHYTPKHGSWLNMAEIELAILSSQCLDRRIPDSDTLASEVSAWEQTRNETATQVNWRFTAADARIKLKHLYPSHQVDHQNRWTCSPDR